MLSVTVHITGVDKAQERLLALSGSLKNFTEALTSLAAKLILFYEDTVFTSEGRELNGAWTALASSTVAEKEKKWPGRGMLERTGDMRHSFKSEVSPINLLITNDSPIFPFHQLGAKGTGRGHHGTLPARHMLGINATVEETVRVEIEADIRAKIEALG